MATEKKSSMFSGFTRQSLGLGFRVQGLGVGVEGLGFRVEG